MLLAHDRLRHAPLQRRHQPHHAPLQEEIVRAGAYRLGRSLLADLAGDHQERDVLLGLFEDLQGEQTAEAGDDIVADDGIPLGALDGLPHRRRVVDALGLDGEPALFELKDDELGVIGRILDYQYSEQSLHFTFSAAARGWGNP